jgi:hypothetical protein
MKQGADHGGPASLAIAGAFLCGMGSKELLSTETRCSDLASKTGQGYNHIILENF